MSITVKEVAAAAGVSLGTVSRVLNAEPSVSTESQAKVHGAMAALGYVRLRRRQDEAKSPLAGRTIALLLLGMDRTLVGLPCVASAIHAAEAELAEAGASLLLVDVPKVDHLPAALERRRIDGVLLKGALQGDWSQTGHCGLLDRLRGMPSVWLLGRPRGAWGDVVQSDDLAVGARAAECLVEHGHRTLAFVNPKPDHVTFCQRQAGFESRAKQLGARVECIEGTTGRWTLPLLPVDSVSVVDELVESLLKLRLQPSAVFAPADCITAMIYRALAKRDLKVGRDISLVSCNNEQPLLAGLFPSVTTVDIHSEEIGRRAVEQLAWRMTHRREAASDLQLAPTLIAGDSVAKRSNS